ncbi:hypothetical protein IL306_005965 [Fusarium sp. DS 682]|nr:hypothetical protein IL306_005965 [Fusarium sp. DS 682]
MKFLSKSLLGLGLLISLVAAAPVPLPSGSTPPGCVTPNSNTTGTNYVGHSVDNKVLAEQREMALNLLPSSEVCEGYTACGSSFVLGKKFITGEVGAAIRNVTVSVEQVKNSPITMRVTVTNNSTRPITFEKNVSPLSPWASDLGYFRYQNEIPNVQFGVRSRGEGHGYRPEKFSDLVQLDAGQSESAEVLIPYSDSAEDKTWLEMLKMAGPTRLSMGGN